MNTNCEKICAYSKDGHCRYKTYGNKSFKETEIKLKNEKCPFFISIKLKGLLP
ncbi:MAG: hypothetical protein VB120_08095 [Lachnospiraceae bacterium]|nr:hypothetical protein [Lachnospiraceae bacterium]